MKIRNAIGLQLVNTVDGFGLHVPHTRELCDPELVKQPGFLALVMDCQAWRDRASVEALLMREIGCADEAAIRAIDDLLARGILIADSEDMQVDAVNSYDAWEAHNWGSAFVFQWHIDNLPRLDYTADGKAEDMAAMREFLRDDPVPSNYKHVPGALVFALERDVTIDHRSIWDILANDEEMLFPDRILTARELSWMTKLAFGQTGVHSTYYGDRLAKTSPSGGARHPTEAYLLVLDVEGIEPGAYHYDVENHALELIQAGDHGDVVRDALLRQPNLALFKHRVAYITGTRFERTMWRYRESFSYRSVNHDLGHHMESTRLVSRALQRNHFRGFAPRESLVEPLLGLDGIEEATMTFSIIG